LVMKESRRTTERGIGIRTEEKKVDLQWGDGGIYGGIV
jgi:hypothetical protein